MKPWEIIEEYLKTRSACTARRYEKVVRDFEKWLGKDIRKAKPFHVLKYMARLKEKGDADNTRANVFHVMHSVYNLLIDMDVAVENPFRRARRAVNRRVEHLVRPTKLIPFNEVLGLIDAEPDTPKGLQRRAILACIFGGGLRRDEVRKLNMEDFRKNELGEYVLILKSTKSGKDRTQCIADWVVQRITPYYNRRRFTVAGDMGAPLFAIPLANGQFKQKRLCTETIYRVYRDRLLTIGIKAGPHTGRATALTRLKQQGLEDPVCAAFLGHSSTRQVVTYHKLFQESVNGAGKMLAYPEKDVARLNVKM